MLQTRTEVYNPYLHSDVVAQETNEDKIEDVISLLDKLNCFELKRIKSLFDKKYNEVLQKDSNYILHDFIDNYFYVVNYASGGSHIFIKGKDAYDEYRKYGTSLVRKTKTLFPFCETLLEKDEDKMKKIVKKQKRKTDKKDYDVQYAKDNIRQIRFVLNRNIDQDIIEHLDNIDNKNGYLKELIRKDIKK